MVRGIGRVDATSQPEKNMTFAAAAKTTALAALLALGAALPAAAEDGRRCTVGATTLSISQVGERLTQQGYRDITRIEREHGCYKVRATDANGRRVHLTLDPTTGAVAATRESG